jgi:hypothetical protein
LTELGLVHASTGEGKERCIVLRKTGDVTGCTDKQADSGSSLKQDDGGSATAAAGPGDDLQEERVDHVARQEREAERRREQKEQQLQKKMQMQQQKQLQQQQKQRQQTILAGAAFLLDSPALPASSASLEPTATAALAAPDIQAASESPPAPPAADTPPHCTPATASSSAPLAIGRPVTLFGLSTEWLNGAHGVIASALDASTGRYLVKIHSPKDVAAKCNVS